MKEVAIKMLQHHNYILEQFNIITTDVNVIRTNNRQIKENNAKMAKLDPSIAFMNMFGLAHSPPFGGTVN